MRPIHAYNYKRILKMKPIYIFLLLFIGTSTYITCTYKVNLNSIQSPFYIYKNIFMELNTLFVVIPLFLLLVLASGTIFNKSFVILKYPSIKFWWYEQSFIILGTAFLYSFVINLLSLILIISKGLDFNNLKLFITYFIIKLFSQFFGFILIGVIYNVLKIFIKGSHICFLITYITIVLPVILLRVYKIKFMTLPDFMFSFNIDQNGYFYIGANDLIYIISCMIFTVVLSVIGQIFLKSKDFIGET